MPEPQVFIPDEWLTSIERGTLFYPSAGGDTNEVLSVFAPFVDEVVFCDLHYPKGLDLEPAIGSGGGYKLIGSSITGDPNSRLHEKDGHLEIEPSTLIEIYEGESADRLLVVKRRRGFGQYALLEVKPKSMTVFMHRGDSPGEGGSNVYYLADCKSRHEPCGRLLTKLTDRLADRAIILSDGSNTRVPQLRRCHGDPMRSAEAFAKIRGNCFSRNGFRWTCVGYLSNRRYGPTLAWGLERENNTEEKETGIC